VPDIAGIVAAGAANPWLYLPLAVLLGALHALEPGHSKSMMAAFIVTVRGTPAQAVLLGLSAAVGHMIIVWVLAFLGLYLGDKLIVERAEPWLTLITGLLLVALAFRVFRLLRPATIDHHHNHSHDHDHNHDAHGAEHASDIEESYRGRSVANLDIVWFGFTGGLLPCPAAIAILLVCLRLGAISLGIGMVAAFSLGLAVTLVAIGVAAAWGARAANQWWSGWDAWGKKLPYVSAVLVFGMGVVFAIRGLVETGLFGGGPG
jgi:nickel/cobalt transporter (NicO) family protein